MGYGTRSRRPFTRGGMHEEHPMTPMRTRSTFGGSSRVLPRPHSIGSSEVFLTGHEA